MRRLQSYLLTLCLLLNTFVIGLAQTSATATVSGTVTDAQGAAVSGADVDLVDTATNQSRKQKTNDAGHFLFPSVKPGIYKITVTMQGFRQSEVPSVKIDVAKSYSVDISLETGQVTEKVEVTASAAVELQKHDATVGAVIGGDALKLLPSLTRDATALILLQPMVTPGRGESENTGGQVAGSRSDQNTFMIDGGDASSNTEGNGAYNTGFVGTPRAVVPTPAESLEEFRVNTNNPNATFGRSAGAQVNLVTKRGTNDLHGSAYWYHQNDNLNANTWLRNRLAPPRNIDPELKDNRFGFSLGGPIIKDKTFIFGHYEGRRFPQSFDILRIVPTQSLKAGVLRFRDSRGGIISYNLANSALCGSGGTTRCDPRGRGISSVVQGVWNLLPDGNDSSVGDGLNTIGFRAAAPVDLVEDFAVARIDHEITSNWSLMVSYRYARTLAPSLAQIDIGGLIEGNERGQAIPTANRPLQPRYFVAGLTGQITSHLTNDFRFNILRHWWEWATAKPFPQVSGTAAALAVAGEGVNSFVDEPINIDTQNARGRIWNGWDWTYHDNLAWVKGPHTFQFGGRFSHQNIIHQRDDKVVGSLTSLVYQVTDGPGLSMPATFRPPTCGGAITANCLQAGDVARWNVLYAATLGIVDTASILATRDGQLNPNPVGTPLREEVTVNSFELFANDIWRLRPSLTLSLGLSYNVQLPPTEKEGKQTLMTIGSGEILDTESYLNRRREAALEGRVYNPQIGFLPINDTGRKYPYDPDWNNLGPRAAFAWNPSFKEGFLGKVFGDGKSVLRGGYALNFDRINGVGIVMVPILGVGFGQTLTCRAPSITGACLGSGGTDPATAFRIGVDGSSIPLPALGRVTPPIIPAVNSPFELLSFQIDPKREVGYSNSFDFTIQRELPGNMLLEVGYVGRVANKLYQGKELNQVPFFMKDPASGQTFAEAFDAVAGAIRSGGRVSRQPWFENMLRGSALCDPNCTAGLAANFATEFENGAVFDLFSAINTEFRTGPIINDQVLLLYMITSTGQSNYNAGFVSLQKRMSDGLTFGINYTLSKSNDQIGYNQNNLNSASNAYDLDFDYGPSIWDRRHTFNAYWYYELPFGRSGDDWVRKLTGGWYTAGLFTAASGLPLDFLQGTCQEWGAGIFGNCAAAIPRTGGVDGTVNKGVAGSNGVGTAGDPAVRGTGLNMFSNPESVFNGFRRIRISQDTRHGRGMIRGLGRWNTDISVGKRTSITESVNLRFSADFTNIFNRVEFVDGGLDLTNPSAFGVLSTPYNRPRFIQLGFRVEF